MSRPLLFTLVALLGSTMLSGCVAVDWPTPFSNSVADYPPYEGLDDDARALTAREKLLAKSDFSVEVLHLSDERTPRSQATLPPEGVIYEYVPDQLIGGVAYRLPVLFNKYLDYRPKTVKNYGVELQIIKLRTVIATGTIWSGDFGRYTVELEARAIARRPDSTVAVKQTFHVSMEQPRFSTNGYSPSKEIDRSKEYDLVESAVRQMSEQIGWQIRQLDSRTWHVTPPAPPVELKRVVPVQLQGDGEHREDLPAVKQPIIPPADDDNTPPVFIEPEQNAQ